MTEETQTNRDDAMDAAVSRRFNPAAVAEAMEDPGVFAQVARGDLYIQLQRLRELASSPNFPAAQRMEYAKFLARMGRVEQPAPSEGGSGFSITINVPSVGDQPARSLKMANPVLESGDAA
jgi:hypothetical protein